MPRDPYYQRTLTPRDFYLSPREPDTQFTDEQHLELYHEALQRIKATGKNNFSLHDLHFHGKGTNGYFWPAPELLNYDPNGKTSFIREPLCGHGVTATTYRFNLPGYSKGKHFVRCGKGKGSSNDCGYWYWMAEIPRCSD